MATKMVPAVQDASRNLPPEGTAWAHVRGTQEVFPISETVFHSLQADGKVEGRYNRFLVVLYGS